MEENQDSHKITHTKNPKQNKIKTLLILVILVVLILSLSLYLVLKKDSNGNGAIDYLSFSSDVCGDEIIKRYDGILKTQESAFDSGFSKITKDITSNKNYKKDADCMYILTEYYIYTRNANSALESYDGLRAISSDSKSLDGDLLKATGIVDYSRIQEAVESMQNTKDAGNVDGDKG